MKTVPDRALASALRENGIRTDAELPRLVSLCWTVHRREAGMSYTGVTSLVGLEACVNLEHVELGGEVRDLAPIANAPKLRALWIHLAQSCAYAPLATATALVELSLTGGRGDLAALANLHKLEKLVIEDAPVVDLTPIADLPALRDVSLWDLTTDVAPGTKNRAVLVGWRSRGVAIHHSIASELDGEVTALAAARGGTSLAERVRQLGEPRVATLLEQGGTNSDGNSALHLAVKGELFEKIDRVAIVRAILEAGVVAIDAVNNDNRTALALATDTYQPNIEVVRVLLDHGANADRAMPHAINQFKKLHEQQALLDLLLPRVTRLDVDEVIRLIELGDLTRVEEALERNEVDLRAMGKASPRTILHAAAEVDNVELVRKLLAAGADPTANTPNGSGYGTPLHRGGSVEIATLFLDAGADVNAVEVTNGHTPLMEAAEHKHFEKCHLLLDRGANVHALTHIKENVLHRLAAVRAPDDERARAFYDRLLGAGIDLEARSNSGETPHMRAKWDFKRAMTRMLKSKQPPKPKKPAKPKKKT